MKYAKVEGSNSLIRDLNSNAVILTDENKVMSARQKKANRLKQKEEFEQMKQDVQNIKHLLNQIVEKL
jgi:Tfp pilus assembly protein PilN